MKGKKPEDKKKNSPMKGSSGNSQQMTKGGGGKKPNGKFDDLSEEGGNITIFVPEQLQQDVHNLTREGTKLLRKLNNHTLKMLPSDKSKPANWESITRRVLCLEILHKDLHGVVSKSTAQQKMLIESYAHLLGENSELEKKVVDLQQGPFRTDEEVKAKLGKIIRQSGEIMRSYQERMEFTVSGLKEDIQRLERENAGLKEELAKK